jgi:transcriptional regulator
MDAQPQTFIDGMLKGLVSFTVPIARIEGKAKLSQNRPAEDRPGIIAALRAGGQTALADAMEHAKT